MTKRRGDGTFEEGSSGNPSGRPRKRRRDPKLPAARRDAIFRVADRMIPMTIDGKTEMMSIFEACVLQLGRAGASGNRISAKDFIHMAIATSETDLMRSLVVANTVERMNAMEVESERLRRKAEHRPVVHVPAVTDFDNWDPRRRLDDGMHEELPSTP
jgi:hypothetical protein